MCERERPRSPQAPTANWKVQHDDVGLMPRVLEECPAVVQRVALGIAIPRNSYRAEFKQNWLPDNVDESAEGALFFLSRALAS